MRCWREAHSMCLLLAAAAMGFGAGLPLSFEANLGQMDSAATFGARGDGYTLSLTSDSAVFRFQSSHPDPVVRMKLSGANPAAKVSASGTLPGKINYFIGNDPNKWTTGASTYSRVHYTQIYQGVDLVYYGSDPGTDSSAARQLEYDFTVAPGADARQIALEFEGAKPRLGSDGSLELTVDGAVAGAPLQISFRRPSVYQAIAGKRKMIAGSYRLTGNRVRFALGKYDHTLPLVIDPVLTYFTYLGGSSDDFIGDLPGYLQFPISPGRSVAADSAGNLYITGFTRSTDFPVQSAYQLQNKGTPANGTPYVAFVTKLDPTGSHLIYSTYLGGADFGQTKGFAIAVDSSGSAYIAGSTQQADFPVTSGAYQKICGYLNNGQTTCGSGAASAFLTKLNPSGGSLAYSTFLGPGTQDAAYSVAVDSQGQAYVAGISSAACASNDPQACFPTTPSAVLPGSTFNGTLQNGTTFNQGSAFISVLDAAGANLLYSSLYGGFGSTAAGSDGKPGNNGATYGAGVAVDASGNFYLAGTSASNQLPVTPGAYQRYIGSTQPRGFIAKFSPVSSKNGASLTYATYLGGADGVNDGSDQIGGIAADAAGNAYVTGNTQSYDFPVTINNPSSCTLKLGCQNTGFLTKVNPTGSGLVWSTLVGASANCCSGDVAIMAPPRLDAAGNVYVSGRVNGSSDFPSVNPVQTPNGLGGLFVQMYDPTGATIYFSTVLYDPTVNGGLFSGGLDVDSQFNIYVAGYGNILHLPATTGVVQPANGGGYDGFLAKISLAPVITPGGVVPNDSNVPTIQPAEWISIYGNNLAGPTVTWNGDFPTSLGNVSVTIDGKPAYLLYVSSTQIDAQVPDDSNTGPVQVVVKTLTGTATSTVTLAAFAPSFSLLDAKKHVAGIIIRTDGSGAYGDGVYDIIGPTGTSLGYATVAAKAGDTLELFGVGFGPTSPSVAAGTLFTSAASTTNSVDLKINNIDVTPSFAGLSAAGLYQFNLTLPPGLGTGDVTLQGFVGGAQTPVAQISLK